MFITSSGREGGRKEVEMKGKEKKWTEGRSYKEGEKDRESERERERERKIDR